MIPKATALADIDAAIGFATRSKTVAEIVSHLHSCVCRYTTPDSSHRRLADKYLQATVAPTGGTAPESMLGIVRSLRAEIDGDHLRTFQSLITADLFSDLLVQAEHLVAGSYRRAAAVLAGATLEEHLRKLATANSIPTVSGSSPVAASTLNAELKRANVYGKAQHAQIDAWQKVRNEAAHGVSGFEAAHSDNDIERMITGVRDFIVKYPP